MKKQEERLHSALATHIKLQYPEVVFTSESSGIRVPKYLAVMMKKQRSKHKQLDMIILEPNKHFHGMILELKKDRSEVYKKTGGIKSNPHIEEQKKTIDLLDSKGYYSDFACGIDEAIEMVDNYMNDR